MSLTMTVLKEGDECQFFADEFPTEPGVKFAMSAKPATFIRRYMFQQDTGDHGPLLTIPLADAKKMAQEILKL
ncbi:hypothetical protein LCGC14_0783290 [marine sediment metagenome]|uniref:Uncharacterized protein n=1 Tax=marine sediment metagenome TaxID=412755 RepID=A0A0F9QEQ4_9ZZZZ